MLTCYCKKDLFGYKFGDKFKMFHKGKTYEYEKVINSEETEKIAYQYWVIHNKNGDLGEIGYRLYKNYKNEMLAYHLFSEYFISDRKLKLDKIKKCQA